MGALSDLLGKRVYLDANVFLYALNAVPPFKGLTEELFKAGDAGSLSIWTSELSIAEVLVTPFRKGDRSAERECRLLLHSDGVKLTAVTQRILEEAARIRAVVRALHLPDAIHLATAIQSGCDFMLTNDQHFRAAKAVPVMMLSEMVR